MSGLSYSNIVQVTSSSVTATPTINKLPTILLQTNNPDLPMPLFTTVNSAVDASNKFGAGSSVDNWAKKYFGFTSKTSNKAETLTVFNMCKTGQGSAVIGSEIDKTIFTVNGTFDFVYNGVATEVEADFTGATTYTQVATIIHNAIDNPNISVTYSPVTKGLIFKSLLPGAITMEFQNFIPADMQSIMGLANPTEIDNIDPMDLNTALTTLQQEQGNYYTIATSWELDADERVILGEFVHASEDNYSAVWWTKDILATTNPNFTQDVKGFNGLVGVYVQNDYEDAFWCGIMSAMDRTVGGGNYDIAFQDSTIFTNYVTKQTDYDNLVANGLNFIGKFALMGNIDVVNQTGAIFGSLTDSINVYTGNSFIKFQEQISLFGMFKQQPIVALRGDAGITLSMSYLTPIYQTQVQSGVIIAGAELTVDERNSVISTFGANGEVAIKALQTDGYYIQVQRIDLATRTMYYATAYVANKPLGRIVIANKILGA